MGHGCPCCAGIKTSITNSVHTRAPHVARMWSRRKNIAEDGTRVKLYRGMGSLDAMKKGSSTRYLGESQKIQIAQGVSGTVRDKGSVRNLIPFFAQAVKQGFQDFGAKDVKEAHAMLEDGRMRMETRSGAAQHEGGVHDMHSYTKKRW